MDYFEAMEELNLNSEFWGGKKKGIEIRTLFEMRRASSWQFNG